MFNMARLVLGLFLMGSTVSGLGLQIVLGLTGLGFFMWSFYQLAKEGALNA